MQTMNKALLFDGNDGSVAIAEDSDGYELAGQVVDSPPPN
jgi:hypothetical protein